MGTVYDLVLLGGRVIDPETSLDGVRNIGITSGTIVSITSEPILGSEVIDISGLVVAPGFIDLHSHAQGLAEHRLQALDGVTTVLELEAGRAPVAIAYARMAAEGRPLNYGFSASWAAARMQVLDGRPMTATFDDIMAGMASLSWRGVASEKQTAQLLGLLEQELSAGALGIGLLLGYAPEIDPQEYARVAALAASSNVPTFTHARPLIEQESTVPVDGAAEIAQVAARTGAHMHYCHINSTSNQYLDRAASVIARAQAEGAKVSVEGYPYGAGMTAIGSAVFEPARLAVLGVRATDLVYAKTGEAVSGVDRLLELRAMDPGGLAFVHYYDEGTNAARLAATVSFPGGAVASDAVPLVPEGAGFDDEAWPPPADVRTHPRTAGTYARTLRLAVRETATLSLAEALAKCSLIPAQILESAAPGMRKKARIQLGCDADLTIFDPATVTDLADYQNTTRPSSGFRHVIVNGRPVVKDGEVQLDSRPGRAVRGRA